MLKRADTKGLSALPVRSTVPYPPGDSGATGWLPLSLLLIAAALALTWPWLTGQVTVPWDARAHFHAQIAFLAQALHKGESPFWAPYVFGGHPQIADPQSMIFSPPHLLLAWLTPNPTFAMVDATTFASLVFGAFGVLGFARDRRWHPAAAIVAAIAFAFAGMAAWRIQHTGQIMSLVYFPWALWMLERGLRLHSARYGAAAGLFAALSLLDPDQVSFLVMVTLAGYTLAHWLIGAGRAARLRASIRPLVAGGIVGLAIVTIPTLMVLSFADGSNRAHIGLQEAELGSMHPSNLLTFVISNLFGTIGRGREFWGAPSVHWPFIVWSYLSRNMVNVYMGALPMIGIVAWIASAEAYRRRAIALLLLFLVMAAYAVGRYTPVFTLIYHLVPGADLFRRPADSLFLVGAIGALLAGYGLDRLLRAPEGRLPRPVRLALTGVIGLAFAGGFGMAIWLGKLALAWPNIASAALTLAAAFLVLAYGLRAGRTHPLRVAAIFAVAITADLAWNIRPNDSTGLPPAGYAELDPASPNETIAFLKANIVQRGDRRDRVELTGLGFHWPNLPLVHRFEATLGYNPLRLGHYSTAIGARDHVAGWDQRKFGSMFWGYHSPFANLLGLRFIALPVPIETVDPGIVDLPLPLVARTKDAYIYENPDALPRVMVVPEGEIADQDALVRTGNWPSTNFRQTVFVEATALPLPRRATGGSARIAAYENTRVEVAVEAPRGGVLLLNDVWHPWWFATIDGQPARVLRANGVFRAVVLPRGAKQVVFTFEPLRGLARRHLVRGGFAGAN